MFSVNSLQSFLSVGYIMFHGRWYTSGHCVRSYLGLNVGYDYGGNAERQNNSYR